MIGCIGRYCRLSVKVVDEHLRSWVLRNYLILGNTFCENLARAGWFYATEHLRNSIFQDHHMLPMKQHEYWILLLMYIVFDSIVCVRCVELNLIKAWYAEYYFIQDHLLIIVEQYNQSFALLRLLSMFQANMKYIKHSSWPAIKHSSWPARSVDHWLREQSYLIIKIIIRVF